MQADFVLRDIGQLLTMDGGAGSGGERSSGSVGVVKDAVLAVEGGRVVWSGRASDFDAKSMIAPDSEVLSASGRVVTPGFVDSHTHPLFGATREEEFAMRAAGADYEEIAAAGGGILNSVRKTRSADRSVLKDNMLHYLHNMLKTGTTTVEAKTGYGLDTETELRCLDVAGEVAGIVPQTVVSTFLGAHEVPEEFRDRSDDYIDFLINELNPKVRSQGIAQFVDIFCEEGVFSSQQALRYLSASAKQGFALKIHADEFSDTGGTEVAVKLSAVSADHLLAVSDGGIKLIAGSNTVATLLPGTALFLNKKFPSGRKLLDAGATVALATDFNPGSSFCDSMPLIVSLAVCRCGFTIEEALVASTVGGAAALGLMGRKGALTPGNDADFVVWNYGDYRSIPYHLGNQEVAMVYCAGKKVYSSD